VAVPGLAHSSDGRVASVEDVFICHIYSSISGSNVIATNQIMHIRRRFCSHPGIDYKISSTGNNCFPWRTVSIDTVEFSYL
jgi:hypothetical protein